MLLRVNVENLSINPWIIWCLLLMRAQVCVLLFSSIWTCSASSFDDLSFYSSVLVDQDSCRNHCGSFHELSEFLSCCEVAPRDIILCQHCLLPLRAANV